MKKLNVNPIKIFALILVLVFFASSLYIVLKQMIKTYVYPLGYKEEVFYYADSYCLDKALVFSVINVESGFDNMAKSRAGALGLMQITESTGQYIAKMLGEKDFDLFNPQTNIKFGCYYLGYLFKQFKSVDTVICAYNAGEGKVREWLANDEYSIDGFTLSSIPYSETKDYLSKIKKTFSKYKELYENILDK